MSLSDQHVSSHLVSGVLGTEPRASGILGDCSSSELQPQSTFLFLRQCLALEPRLGLDLAILLPLASGVWEHMKTSIPCFLTVSFTCAGCGYTRDASGWGPPLPRWGSISNRPEAQG